MASKKASLEDLYTDMLKDLYSAEKQLVKALPKMVKAAQSAELQRAFQDHLKQTEGHVDRIERIFSEMDGSPGGKKCVGMEGLVEEGSELLKEDVDPEVMDAGLIAAAQKVEIMKLPVTARRVRGQKDWEWIMPWVFCSKLWMRSPLPMKNSLRSQKARPTCRHSRKAASVLFC